MEPGADSGDLVLMQVVLNVLRNPLLAKLLQLLAYYDVWYNFLNQVDRGRQIQESRVYTRERKMALETYAANYQRRKKLFFRSFTFTISYTDCPATLDTLCEGYYSAVGGSTGLFCDIFW